MNIVAVSFAINAALTALYYDVELPTISVAHLCIQEGAPKSSSMRSVAGN